jgi:hypothetical protein
LSLSSTHRRRIASGGETTGNMHSATKGMMRAPYIAATLLVMGNSQRRGGREGKGGGGAYFRNELINLLAGLGGVAGMYWAIEINGGLRSVTCSALSGAAKHAAVKSGAAFAHASGSCIGQTVLHYFLVIVGPTVIGIFAGMLLAGIFIRLPRLLR